MPLDKLQLRGGGSGDNTVAQLVCCFRARHEGRCPTVKELACLIQCVPCHEKDELVREYLPRPGGVPEFLRTLVVGREDDDWRIGDGYHRSVAMWILGIRKARCYAGELRTDSQ